MQCDDKEHQANAVAGKPYQHGGRHLAYARKMRTQQERDTQIDRTGDQPFQAGNDHRVVCRHLPRQVVVDGPRNTGRHDQQCTYRNASCTIGDEPRINSRAVRDDVAAPLAVVMVLVMVILAVMVLMFGWLVRILRG